MNSYNGEAFFGPIGFPVEQYESSALKLMLGAYDMVAEYYRDPDDSFLNVTDSNGILTFGLPDDLKKALGFPDDPASCQIAVTSQLDSDNPGTRMNLNFYSQATSGGKPVRLGFEALDTYSGPLMRAADFDSGMRGEWFMDEDIHRLVQQALGLEDEVFSVGLFEFMHDTFFEATKGKPIPIFDSVEFARMLKPDGALKDPKNDQAVIYKFWVAGGEATSQVMLYRNNEVGMMNGRIVIETYSLASNICRELLEPPESLEVGYSFRLPNESGGDVPPSAGEFDPVEDIDKLSRLAQFTIVGDVIETLFLDGNFNVRN